MNKLIFFDVDNTLICRESNHICESTLKSIQMCKNNDVEIAIATGRSLAMVKQEGIDQLAEIIIASNGSMMTIKGEVIYEQSMHPQKIKELIKVLHQKSIPYVVHKKNESIGNLENPWIKELASRYNMQFNDWSELGDEAVYQLNAKISLEEIQVLKEQFNMFRFVPLIDIAEGYDIFSKECSKGSAVRYLKQYYKNKACKYYGFGDGFNDLEMFEEVDYSIAMGNGCEALKQKADYITDHINNQGIYKALKKFNII